jgi:hypothetical protein
MVGAYHVTKSKYPTDSDVELVGSYRWALVAWVVAYCMWVRSNDIIIVSYVSSNRTGRAGPYR